MLEVFRGDLMLTFKILFELHRPKSAENTTFTLLVEKSPRKVMFLTNLCGKVG